MPCPALGRIDLRVRAAPRCATTNLCKPVRCTAFIVRPGPVAMRGRRTIGRSRLLPSTELYRPRRSANDGSVADHVQLVSSNHLIGNSEQRRWRIASAALLPRVMADTDARKRPANLGRAECVDDAGAAVDTTLPTKNRKSRMRRARGATASIICAVLCLCAAFAQAGPCSEDIAQFEAAIRQSAGNPYAGLTGPQSVGAQLEQQPTPQSVKRAQLPLRANFAAPRLGASQQVREVNRSAVTFS